MSKLWIVHRNPQQRASLARLSGLAESELVSRSPNDPEFASESAPAAILLGLVDDFEHELEFAHRHRARLAEARWLLFCAPEDALEARRLFHAIRPEILSTPPSARSLRAFVAAAVARRGAASLAQRQERQRIAKRFSAWLGGVEVPGLMRALDPSLVGLPLLVRGVPGSGRSLLCRYIEIFRNAPGSVLRLSGRDRHPLDDLASRLRACEESGGDPIDSVWIDEVDALSVPSQNTLAEWIAHGSSPLAGSTTGLRWIATAGAAGFEDPLEVRLAQAFAPLWIEVPAISDHPETLAAFAEEIANDWTQSVGGVARRFADSALSLLEAHPWSGDRAELEAVLRTSLAASSRETLEDVDLRFPSDPPASEPRSAGTAPTLDSIRGLTALPDEETVEEVVEADNESEDTPEARPETVFEKTRMQAAAPDEAPELQPDHGWRRLARSLAHEIRNPLVSIRTFAELLPEHFDDETFRARYSELVVRDVARISDVLTRLSSVVERESIAAEPVDVSAMIEALLEERRERIAQGRLLVLRELERDSPIAWADAQGLRVALAGLLDRALESLPERGDLFVATRRIERGADGRPRLRILLRHHNPAAAGKNDAVLAELDPTANGLEYVLAQAVVESSGGSLTLDASDARETVILIELRTPSE